MSESFDFAAETFACSLGGWIVPRKPTLRNGFCRAEENIDLVSKLRRLLPGKETRSAEENVERPKTDAFGIKFRRGRTSVKGNVVKRMCIVHLNLLPHL